MASKYWIKLYHEILHDPKMGTMPDHLWRRAIEMMLVAGDLNESGWLPAVRDMAWTLRCDEGELIADLTALQRIGLITCEDGAWFVTNFATRQGAMSATERSRRYRTDEQRAEYDGETNAERTCNDSATKAHADIDIDIDTDKEVDIDNARAGATTTSTADPVTAAFYQGLTGLGVMPASQMQVDTYNDIVAQIRGVADPPEFMRQLFAEAAATTSGRVTPRWFEVVTDRCIREGRLPGDKRASPQARAPAQEHSEADWLAVAAELGQAVGT